jgi:hypothetical protein
VLVVAVTLLAGSLVVVPWLARSSGARAGFGPHGRSSVGTGGGWSARDGMRGGGMRDGGRTGGGYGMNGGRMGAGPMGAGMAGRVWLTGDGVAVPSVAAARARATTAAAVQGLHPGEVIQFSNGFYVELKDTTGAAVTEVLVDPASGAVSTEPGPAMMWNTGSRTAAVSVDQARAIASGWLVAHRPGETIASVDAYPGYYTLDTSAAGAATGAVVGMMSVNATTGAVWYHTWHGTFVAREDS